MTIQRSINALAGVFNSLFKAELVRNQGPWKSIDDLEIVVVEYVVVQPPTLAPRGRLVPPAQFEDDHYRHTPAPTAVGASVQRLC